MPRGDVSSGGSASHVSPGEDLPALFETFVYKVCSNVELVVRRKFRLYSTKFCTYHDPKDAKDKKTWYLHRNCALAPKKAEEITQQKRLIRPQGMSSISATFKGAGEPINLYLFTVHFPPSWTAKGYSSVTIGCESVDTSIKLHKAIDQQLCALKAKGSSFRIGTPLPTSSVHDDVSLSDVSSDSFTSAKDFSRSNSMASARSEDSQDPTSFTTPSTKHHTSARSASPDSPHHSDSGIPGHQHHQDDIPEPLRTSYSCDYDHDYSSSERWVPYRHTNGVAIYYHSSNGRARTDGQRGEEYMASTIVRGSTKECLDVLMNPRSHTTILGPASHIKVLQKERDWQLLRIQIEATGTARRLCAPREAIVERAVEHAGENGGSIRVMFGSVEQQEAQAYLQGSETTTTSSTSSSSSLWARPVRATVRGGYTISPQAQGAEVPECLVTLILQVDLGGCCGDASWFRFAADAMGWVDAYVERILMSVILIKDEVEQARFMHSPFRMLSTAAAAPPAAEPASEAAEGRMSTRVGRVRSCVTPRAAAAALAAAEDGSGRWCGVEVAAVVGAAAVEDGPQEPLAKLGTLEQQYWSELHAPGQPAPFKVRGASYLTDRRKVDAGESEFCLAAVDLVITGSAQQHISRYLPSVRKNRAPFSFVVNLIIPGTPMLSLVMVFVNEHHPGILGDAPPDPAAAGGHDWQPFDFLLYRFLHASDAERNSMFKLIPHIADGSWVIKQSVGTTPVLLGNKLQTKYYRTATYIEASIDVSSSSAAAYITGMVRGATKSLVIDMAFLLEGQAQHELPETLIGGMRLHHLDLAAAKRIDTSRELPLLQPSCSKRAADSAAPKSMTGSHSRRSSNASEVEHALEAGSKGRQAKAAPEPSPKQQESGGGSRARHSSPGGVPAPAAAAAAAAAAPPAKVLAVPPPELTLPSSDSIKASTYHSCSTLEAVEEVSPNPAAPEQQQEEQQQQQQQQQQGSGSKPGRMKKLIRHIKKLSGGGGGDADWAAATYKQQVKDAKEGGGQHIRKSSVSALNLGY